MLIGGSPTGTGNTKPLLLRDAAAKCPGIASLWIADLSHIDENIFYMKS